MTTPVVCSPPNDVSVIEESPSPVGEHWLPIRPPILQHRGPRLVLRRCARQLAALAFDHSIAENIAAIRADAVSRASQLRARLAVPLTASAHVLCDLRAQGWRFRVDRFGIEAAAPTPGAGNVLEEKARVRTAHLIERDAQLSQPSVRRFVRSVERPRLVGSEWKSIFALMRDGRDLADRLRQVAADPDEQSRAIALRAHIDPYVQVVYPNAVCEFTGIKLSHIWRYFRHTWITTYQSTPGRKLFFLIRDRAADSHPVIGIGALGSAIVQLSVRDEWIGWTGGKLVGHLHEAPTASWARWILDSIADLIHAVLIDDLVREGVVTRTEIEEPTPAAVSRLRAFATKERAVHHLYPDRGQHKRAQLSEDSDEEVDWSLQAATHLFRSKRALSLAELLNAKRKLRDAGLERGTATQLRRALDDRDGVAAIHTVLRYMKAARVGVSMMDITVCGAVAPYNELLGGKLVSMLMASPAVVSAYNERYKAAPSVIASSMAGKSVRRRPQLVLLGTTSLYSAGASQYNRIKVPSAEAGGAPGRAIAYLPLGRTVGYGSYHFSRDTMAAFDVVLRRRVRGRPVNSIFGEGVNPKLRKVRGALDAIGFPSDLLLQHGSPRLVYAVPLAENFREVLLGRSARPGYLIPQTNEATAALVDYWRVRWLSKRILQPGVLNAVSAQSLVRPLRHGARVVLPELLEESGPLFAPVRL
jgi:hypothetical protein